MAFHVKLWLFIVFSSGSEQTAASIARANQLEISATLYFLQFMFAQHKTHVSWHFMHCIKQCEPVFPRNYFKKMSSCTGFVLKICLLQNTYLNHQTAKIYLNCTLALNIKKISVINLTIYSLIKLLDNNFRQLFNLSLHLLLFHSLALVNTH